MSIWLRSILLIATLSFYPLSLAFAANPELDVTAYISADGSIELEGVRYTEAKSLKAKIDEINARTPQPDFHVKFPTGGTVRFEVVGKAILMLQAAGAAPLKLGFITKPRTR